MRNSNGKNINLLGWIIHAIRFAKIAWERDLSPKARAERKKRLIEAENKKWSRWDSNFKDTDI